MWCADFPGVGSCRHASSTDHLPASLSALCCAACQLPQLSQHPPEHVRVAVPVRLRASDGQRLVDGAAHRRQVHRRLSSSARSEAVHHTASVHQHRPSHGRFRRLLSAEVFREPRQVRSQWQSLLLIKIWLLFVNIVKVFNSRAQTYVRLPNLKTVGNKLS